MGPNGSGKSTLAKVLAGHPAYEVTNGEVLFEGRNRLALALDCRAPENAVVLVTHYQRLLNYIVPDHVHVLYRGRIVRSGGKELALELEEKGYDWIKEAVSNQQSAIGA